MKLFIKNILFSIKLFLQRIFKSKKENIKINLTNMKTVNPITISHSKNSTNDSNDSQKVSFNFSWYENLLENEILFREESKEKINEREEEKDEKKVKKSINDENKKKKKKRRKKKNNNKNKKVSWADNNQLVEIIKVESYKKYNLPFDIGEKLRKENDTLRRLKESSFNFCLLEEYSYEKDDGSSCFIF